METAIVYDLYKAENQNLDVICSWMNLEQYEARAAVRFERLMAAA